MSHKFDSKPTSHVKWLMCSKSIRIYLWLKVSIHLISDDFELSLGHFWE